LRRRKVRPLGVAHAFFIDEGCAEIAFVVANDGRHLGVGRMLLERLLAALQQRRCTSVMAYALAQNRPTGRAATWRDPWDVPRIE